MIKVAANGGLIRLFGELMGTALIGIAVFCLALVLTRAAWAQAIESVTVQARGQEEAIRDIPVAITAIDQKSLETFSLNSLADVAAHTPGLEIVQTGAGSATSISIRGISSSQGSIGIEQDVAIIIDGVYFPQGRAINEGLFDTRQVAILKGPQALFFGKNATAGAISIETNDPGSGLEVMARVGYEVKQQSLDGEAMISIPLNDKWGIRFAMQGTDMMGGYMKNAAIDSPYTTFDAANNFQPTVHDNPPPASDESPGQKNIQGRVTLKGQLTDALSVRLKGSYASVRTNDPSLSELVSCPALNGIPSATAGSGTNQFPVPSPAGGDCLGNWVTYHNAITPDIAAVDPGMNRFNRELGTSYKSANVTGELNYDLDWLNIQGIFNYQRQVNSWVCDCDGGGTTSTFANEHSIFTAYSGEMRAATSFDGPVNGVVGLYYQHTHRYFEQTVDFAGAENSAVVDPTTRYTAYNKISETTDNTYSAYAELRWAITDEWKLTGGARYIHEKKESYFVQPYVNPAYSGLFVQGVTLTADQPEHAIIPEATLTWTPSDWLTIYGAYKQGWKSGGFDNGAIYSTLNADPLKDITFQPEKVEGWEGGIKASLADGALDLELNVYTYKYNNLQLNFFNAPTFAYITLNAGGARSRGVDLSATWAPPSIDGLTVNASVSYNDAFYTSFVAPCAGGQSIEEGCVAQPGAALQTQQLDGRPRNNAPKWSGNLGFDYSHPFGNGLEWGLSGNVKWKTRYSLSEFTPWLTQGSYAMLDAAIRIGTADGKWQFSVIGKNLTNHYVVVYVADAAGTGGNTGLPNAFPSDSGGTPLLPRTVKLELTYRY